MLKIGKRFILLLVLVCITIKANNIITSKMDSQAARLRRQYSNRLQKSTDLLQHVKCKRERFFEIGSRECDCTFTSHYRFQHKATAHCVAMMEKSKDFTPLIRLASNFTNFAHLHDEKFSREFLLLVFIAYRNLIVNNAPNKEISLKSNVLNTITRVYEELETISHEQIMEAIDLLAAELPPLLEQKELSWCETLKQWHTEYWWVPPIVGILFGIHITRIYLEPKAKSTGT